MHSAMNAFHGTPCSADGPNAVAQEYFEDFAAESAQVGMPVNLIAQHRLGGMPKASIRRLQGNGTGYKVAPKVPPPLACAGTPYAPSAQAVWQQPQAADSRPATWEQGPLPKDVQTLLMLTHSLWMPEALPPVPPRRWLVDFTSAGRPPPNRASVLVAAALGLQSAHEAVGPIAKHAEAVYTASHLLRFREAIMRAPTSSTDCTVAGILPVAWPFKPTATDVSDGMEYDAEEMSDVESVWSEASSDNDDEEVSVLVGPTQLSVAPHRLDEFFLAAQISDDGEVKSGSSISIRSSPGSLSLGDIVRLSAARSAEAPLSFGSMLHLCNGEGGPCRPCMFERWAGRCNKKWLCDFCHLHVGHKRRRAGSAAPAPEPVGNFAR
mmetsp:Transcript_86355/g.278889  ORF Transcript_86355/g.278889 Transcript_86355/m.278889 type:complete len:379 (-) Transcript_86355:326-1462(-)